MTPAGYGMSVTLVQVLAAARARLAPLVGETAGYLVLGVADQVAAAPRQVGAAHVTLAEDGTLRLVGGAAAEDVQAETSLRRLLGELLDPARSATPALLRSSRRASGAGLVSLYHL